MGVALAVLAIISLLVAVLASWVERDVFDSGEFADRAVVVLQSAAVRHALAEELTDALIAHGETNLASYRAVLLPLVDDVVGTPAFQAIFRSAIVQAHRTILARDADRGVLDLGETLAVLTSSGEVSHKDVVARLPSEASALLIDVAPVLHRLRPWRISERIRWVATAAWVVVVIAVMGGLILERRRRRFLFHLGIGIAVDGLAVLGITLIAPRAATAGMADAELAHAISGAVGRFVSDLAVIGAWMIGLGALVAAAATATGAPHLVTRARVWGRNGVESAAGRRGRIRQLLVGVGLGLIAVAAVAWREDVPVLLVWAAGAFLGYLALLVVFTALLGRPVAAAHATRPAPARRREFVEALAIGVLVVAVVAGGFLAVRAARAGATDAAQLRCNGSTALCDRRLDEVVFPGSHNSMSAADQPGWLFPENLRGIRAQLEYGVRALLVKTHYGVPTGIEIEGTALVVTDTAREIANNAAEEIEELSPQAVARAEQLEKTVPPDPSASAVYLCHVYCSLGATKFSDALADIRRFLDRHPDQVVMLFIGDYVSPADTAKEFQAAHLLDRVWHYDTTQPPPTLRQMVQARRNLLVLAEHQGGSPDWYTKGYGIFQDTPFTFASPAQFSCAHNRGPADAPLFELNHFITNNQPPSAQTARDVNSYSVLMGRVRQCEAERGLEPTIIAVNFYDQGDLLQVTHDLNGG